ncbi:MAG TPA: biopolymer transporter ExbD [Flavobacteriaceae bacterium]|nr:biopolymer transporter ExbD [Flavobacteriaceae bacterium]
MNFRGRNKVSAEFNMSSMTDVIFLLLIFFLLTSPAITPNALDLILPKAQGKTTNVQQVSISISKDLAFYIDDQQIAKNQISGRLNQVLKDANEPTVLLRTAEGVPIEEAVFVMDIANKNNYKIVLAVRPE